MVASEVKGGISPRDNIFRKAQNLFNGHASDIIGYLNNRNLLPGTAIEKKLKAGEALMPDDITISQLEMTVQICSELKSSGLYKNFTRNYLLAFLLDGMDGALARHLGIASPEGAMKDVIVDRLSEHVIARHIATERNMYEGCPEDLGSNLATAFQLSTLTKAACEMCGVKTTEGGVGSMLERRRILYSILHDLGKLRLTPEKEQKIMRKLLKRIDDNNELLISNSQKGARERIDAISKSEKSFATMGEAGKYIMLSLMNKRLGIDIVRILNDLAQDKVTFPSIEYVLEKCPDIFNTIVNISEFYNNALKISELKDKTN